MSRSTNWCFTINNPTADDWRRVRSLGSTYYIVGKEVGEDGTPHLQGYCRFKNARSLATMKKKLPRAHLEVIKGTPEQNIVYCSKDGDFEEEGVRPKVGRPTEKERIERNIRLRDTPLNELVENGEINICQVRSLKNARMDLLQESSPYSAEDVRGVWYWGPPGTGKSHTARTAQENLYVKPQNKWWDGYTGEKVVLLDDLDTPTLGHYLKIWADKWSCSGEVKGGTVNLLHDKFIVTSNYHPSDLWPDDKNMADAIIRRFKIIHLLIKHT